MFQPRLIPSPKTERQKQTEKLSLLTSVIEKIMGEATEPTYPYIGRLITIRTLCEDTLEKIK